MDTNILENISNLADIDTAGKLKAAAIIMDKYGDEEMAQTLNLLSAQMDFASSDEGDEVINKTKAKLDKMIKERNERHAMNYLNILQDKDVTEMCNGIVRCPDFDMLRSEYYKNGLFDPDIFGGEGKIPVIKNNSHSPLKCFGESMGYIELPMYAVLRAHYFIIAGLLKLRLDDIDRIMKYQVHVVTDSSTPEYTRGQILTEQEYRDLIDNENYKAKVSTDIGGNAIYKLLCSLNYPDHPERLAFKNLPVIGTIFRPMAYLDDKDKYRSSELNSIYTKIINRVNRINKLTEYEAPEILIRNEFRMLQNAVTELDEKLSEISTKLIAMKKQGKNVIKGYISQIAFSKRHKILSFERPDFLKKSEIESIHVYPEKILCKGGDTIMAPDKNGHQEVIHGEDQLIKLSDVIAACEDAMTELENNAPSWPIDENGDTISEDEVDENTKKKWNEYETTYQKMQQTMDDIMEGARKFREKFRVEFHNDTGMYVPC